MSLPLVFAHIGNPSGREGGAWTRRSHGRETLPFCDLSTDAGDAVAEVGAATVCARKSGAITPIIRNIRSMHQFGARRNPCTLLVQYVSKAFLAGTLCESKTGTIN